MPAADPFAPPPRTVKPRTRKYKRLPIMAIVEGLTLSESGEVGTTADLIENLPAMRSTLFAKQAAADFTAQLDQHFAKLDPKHWQWRASTHERDIVRPDGIRVATRINTLIHYFGFKGHYFHKIIDPVPMYGRKLDEIWPDDRGFEHLRIMHEGRQRIELIKLLKWATELRDFCNKNGLDIRPTIGGISSQLLTDRRFYPHPRRKVPMATNENAREALPGNHYVLNVMATSEREFTALYLDQHRAHHYHARLTELPDSNQLYAYGRFVDLKEISFPDVFPNFYGLYCLDLERPMIGRRSHWITKPDKAFVFSNELPHLRDMGYKITGVYAAWGSFKRDTGLARYARWASRQLDQYGDLPWIKPLLLAAYGTLATRPKEREAVFRLAKRGERVSMFVGHNELSGLRIVASKKLEPAIANVIHRGMIEAATRSESVGFGQYLTHAGYRVLSVYADAVIIEDHPVKPAPSLIDPWRCKQKLNHLQFINQQAFQSGEMTKLPGVSRELLQYRQHRKPGHAPRLVQWDAITNEKTITTRRI